TLGKAEMIIHQKVDVGNVGLAGDLVEKNPDQDGGIDGKHQAPGALPHTQIHSAPGNSDQSKLSHEGCLACNAGLFPNAGTTTAMRSYRINRLKSAFLARSPTCFCT